MIQIQNSKTELVLLLKLSCDLKKKKKIWNRVDC